MGLTLRMDPKFTAALRDFHGRVSRTQAFTSKLGKVMANDWKRHIFRNNSWRQPGGRSGRPLIDSLRLYLSIAWRALARRVEVYTRVPYGAIHNGQRGAVYTVRPKRASFLAIPNPQRLGARAMRGAKPSDYQRLVARKGARGFGLYQASPQHRNTAREPHFFLKKSVQIRARPYLYWTREWIGRVANSFVNYTVTGKWTEFPGGATATGGNPDVGARGGGRP